MYLIEPANGWWQHMLSTTNLREEMMPTLDELNQPSRLANFPPELRWGKVEAVQHQPLLRPDSAGLVSISGLDHKGAEVKFWTDLPNAMYLLNMLAHLQNEIGAKVPLAPPNFSKPYDGMP